MSESQVSKTPNPTFASLSEEAAIESILYQLRKKPEVAVEPGEPSDLPDGKKPVLRKITIEVPIPASAKTTKSTAEA